MKNWIISSSDSTDKYLITSEKAIWISDQQKGVNINDLIATKNLGKIKSIRYEDLKEIIFIDSDFTIELNYIDDKTTDEEFNLDKNIYSEIRSYLKTNLKGTELKNYSVFKQITPHIIVLIVSGVITGLTYFSALELESGNSIRITGRRAWLKQIIASIAEVLGTTGTLIVGLSIIGLLAYFITKKIKNPKMGEILKITNSPKLSI